MKNRHLREVTPEERAKWAKGSVVLRCPHENSKTEIIERNDGDPNIYVLKQMRSGGYTLLGILEKDVEEISYEAPVQQMAPVDRQGV